MAAVGGSILSVALDGREFPVAADADSNRKFGGFENEVQANGDGESARLIKTRTTWMVDGLTVEIDDSRDDHEFLQALANRTDYFPVVINYASGISYGNGRGQIVSDLQSSSQNATAPLSLAGPGVLAKI